MFLNVLFSVIVIFGVFFFKKMYEEKEILPKSLSLSKWKNKKKEIISQTYDLENATPEFCLDLIDRPSLNLFTSLFKVIKRNLNEKTDWIAEFIEKGGIFKLITSIENQCKLLQKSAALFNSIVISKSLNCLQELMNSRLGMESLINIALGDKSCVETFVNGTIL